ncbi:hypothetical protein [Devosia sp. Root635]|uniref:hypothetical protein n=1 Tax=Devosia sp. Root635 TaxID=1736575 RepID=UPI0006F31064|nr:hypothetical protein [Devosia sp. Root635]KRA42555.1 hypothetical protein ASD80_08890 [Devosia sp. Root635]
MTKNFVVAISAAMLAMIGPAQAWILEDDDFIPAISQVDQTGQFELRMICDALMGSYAMRLTTNQIWSDADAGSGDVQVAFEINGDPRGSHGFVPARGRSDRLGADVVELTLYEGAAGWDRIATALPVAKDMIVIQYGDQAIEFEAGNYNDASWELYDACS